MPDTQPTAARELARKWFRCPCGTPYGERRDYDGNSPPDDEPHAPEDFDAGVERMTVEIAAYAVERIAETHANVRGAVAALAAERDAAIARAEAAEADWRMEKGVRDVLVERVRMLAALWESQADDYPAEGKYAAATVRLCARELRAALANAAPEPAAHKEER